MTIFTFRITVTRLTTGQIGNVPVILSAFVTLVTNNVQETLAFSSVQVTLEVEGT